MRVEPGQVWVIGAEDDPEPWVYLVLRVDGDEVTEMVLCDSDGGGRDQAGKVRRVKLDYFLGEKDKPMYRRLA